MFTFVDRDTGRVLALRADITPQIARTVATRMRDEPKPIRLAYLANVFRYEEPQVSQYRELYQAGVELIGPEGTRPTRMGCWSTAGIGGRPQRH